MFNSDLDPGNHSVRLTEDDVYNMGGLTLTGLQVFRGSVEPPSKSLYYGSGSSGGFKS